MCKLAEVLNLEVWQLLAPDAGPAPAAYSARALRVAAIYDQVSAKDRRYIDAAADAASSEDAAEGEAEDARPTGALPLPAPRLPRARSS